MNIHPIVERVAQGLRARAALTEDDVLAVCTLPFTFRTLDASASLVREGETPEQCALLLSGFAYRHKVTSDGRRQILSVHMPGEFVDMQNSFLGIADHNVQALTRIEVATVAVSTLRRLCETHPLVGRALWIETLIDAAVFREWIVNVGRRDATTRLAHLLCEFALRLEGAGLASDGRYELPMTQEQLADATGLTSVHVNRVLKELQTKGLIRRNKRAVEIIDWDALAATGDFSVRYLHFEAGGPVRLPPSDRLVA